VIEFFKELVDLVNFFHSGLNIDGDQLRKEKELYILWINSINFYDNVIVITKAQKPRNTSYGRFLTGGPNHINAIIGRMEVPGYKVDWNRE